MKKKLFAVAVALGLWHSAVLAQQPTGEIQPPKEVEGLRLVLTEKGAISFADGQGMHFEGVPPTKLMGYASNEILNVTSYTVIQLKKNPCFVLVCGRVCAWQKVSDGPCPVQ